jgi:adenosylcobinamide-GDP ribazoletransferase
MSSIVENATVRRSIMLIIEDSVRALKNLFGFFTILPIKMDSTTSMETVSKHFFLCPLVGVIIGLISGILGWILQFLLPRLLVGFLVLAFILIISGFQHFDGLLDLSDALIVRGDPLTKVNVMHDPHTGAAAVAVGFITLVLTALSFGMFQGTDLIVVAVISALTAKESMVLMAFFGKTPQHKGMGYFVVESMQKRYFNLFISVGLSSIVSYMLIGMTFIYLLVPVFFLTVILASYANRALNGVSGDVLGATNELNQMITVLALVAVGSSF